MSTTPAGGEHPDLQTTIEALSSPVRREILWLVWRDELAAGDIAAAFDLAPATISGHLAALRAAGLVILRSDGNFRRYRANPEQVGALIPLLHRADNRWEAADDLPERAHATSRSGQLVVASVDVPTNPRTASRAFTDPGEYSRWLGVPVSIRDGRFACTLEWGTHVRGHYDLVVPGELIAMRWDFENDAVPVPGEETTAYLRFSPTSTGCHVEAHQHAIGLDQVEFFTAAWTMVLGRFAVGHDAPARPRAGRPKLRRTPT